MKRMTENAVKGIIIMFICLTAVRADAASLEITCPDCANATVGSEITCTVSVNSAPNKVKSFGFKILYNPDMLVYIKCPDDNPDCEKGSLIEDGFGYFGINDKKEGEISVGELICGGAETDIEADNIPEGTTGELIKLTFQIKASNSCNLKFSNLTDDFIQCWSANPPIVPEVPDGQIFSIPENSQNGKYVDTVAVNDNISKTHLKFSITGGNTDNVFAISDTGNITVQNSAPLNYMNIPEYSLNISVSACNETTQSIVKVKLIPLKGNINSDSNIDLQDVILALQTLTGIQSDSISVNADINNDQKIGMEEAIFIMRNVAEIK